MKSYRFVSWFNMKRSAVLWDTTWLAGWVEMIVTFWNFVQADNGKWYLMTPAHRWWWQWWRYSLDCPSSTCWELDMQNCIASTLSRYCQSAPLWTPWTNPLSHPENSAQTPDNASHLCFTPRLNYWSVCFRSLGSIWTRSIIHQISCLTACPCKSAIAQLWLRSMHHSGIILVRTKPGITVQFM